MAFEVAAKLRELGAKVWIAPEDIPSGQEWNDSIVRAILQECSCFLVILSAASIQSPWVNEEIKLAEARWRGDGQFLILPLMIGHIGQFSGSEFVSRFQAIPYQADSSLQVQELAIRLQLADPVTPQIFFDQVADLFSLFGYEIKPQSAHSNPRASQLLATSPRRNRPDLMVKCLARDAATTKIDVADVEYFAAAVAAARMEGVIDQGYLVAQAGFTPAAREALQGQPRGRFVFLVTYEELLQSLLDVHNYLSGYIRDYEEGDFARRFVPLRALDTCGFPATIFDACPGDQIIPAADPLQDFKLEGLIGLVLAGADVSRFVSAGLAQRHDEAGTVSIEWSRLAQSAIESSRALYADDDADYICKLFTRAGMSVPRNFFEGGTSDATAFPTEEAASVWREVIAGNASLFAAMKIVDECGECLPAARRSPFGLDLPLSPSFGELAISNWRIKYGAQLKNHLTTQPAAVSRTSRAKRSAGQSLSSLIQSNLTQSLEASLPRALAKARRQFMALLGRLEQRRKPKALDSPERDLHAAIALWNSPECARGLRHILQHCLAALWKREQFVNQNRLLVEDILSRHDGHLAAAFARREIAQSRAAVAGQAMAQKMTRATLSRLGYRNAESLGADVAIDANHVLSRLFTSEPVGGEPDEPHLLGRRFSRDLRRAFLRELTLPSPTTRQSAPAQNDFGAFSSVMHRLVFERLEREDAHHEVRLLPEVLALDLLAGFVEEFNSNLLIVFGDFGAGKTTLIRRFMQELARNKLARLYDSGVRIPFLINLRDYNKVPDFTSLIRRFLSEEAEMGDIQMRLVRRLNDDGRFVFLLDGFDEMLAKVTKPDRRRCFMEIASFIGPKSKVILTGRPGYFPEHAEFAEVLDSMGRQAISGGRNRVLSRLACLQLMDDGELDEFVARYRAQDAAAVQRLFQLQPSLRDLARRPVLAGMMVESAAELAALGQESVSLRQLYELYTRRWIATEEDKGSFRVLIDPEKKGTFLRYLAMQMHLAGQLSVHYRELDGRLAKYFELDASDTIDHFSHDVRTCSFLNRSDAGEYRFIHKSFMEYFAACEFEFFDRSPFADSFDKPLTSEMIAFVDFARLQPGYEQTYAVERSLRANQHRILDPLNRAKEDAVANQDFELAAGIRETSDRLSAIIHRPHASFASMKSTKAAADISTELKAAFKWISRYPEILNATRNVISECAPLVLELLERQERSVEQSPRRRRRST